VDIDVSIVGIIETIDQVTIENSGTFISYDGEVQSWLDICQSYRVGYALEL